MVRKIRSKLTKEEIKKKASHREHARLIKMNSTLKTLCQMLQLPEKTKKLVIMEETIKYIKQLETMLAGTSNSIVGSQDMLPAEEHNPSLTATVKCDDQSSTSSPHSEMDSQDSIPFDAPSTSSVMVSNNYEINETFPWNPELICENDYRAGLWCHELPYDLDDQQEIITEVLLGVCDTL